MNRLLLVILIVAAILRFYKLENYPIAISWDEAAIGYNAYSIAKTGNDEYGQKFPLLFQSFNDFKLPGYIYLDSLSVKILGLSNFSVRLPSALLGVFAVWAIYLLAKELFDQKIAYLTSALSAISPWHLQFSRGAFESNGALTLVLLGAAFLLLGIKNKTLALLSIPTLVLSLYFYYSPRIFVPVIVVVFFIFYKDEIKKNLKFFAFGFLTAIVISLPITFATLSQQGTKRVREVSIFSDHSLSQIYADTRLKTALPLEGIWLNRYIPYAQEVLKNYYSYFSPTFLFFTNDPNPRHHSYGHGHFYLFETATVLLGSFLLLRQKNQKAKNFLIAWLILAPIPASLAKESPHSLRALLMLPPLLISSAIGAKKLLEFRKIRLVSLPIILFSAIFYIVSYYVLYPSEVSQPWGYGHKMLYSKLASQEDTADTIIVTGHYWKPYIFYLYYNKIDPALYQSNLNQERIGKYSFGTTYWDSGGSNLTQEQIASFPGTKKLVVLSPSEFNSLSNKDVFKIKDTISDYSGKNMLFMIGEWNEQEI